MTRGFMPMWLGVKSVLLVFSLAVSVTLLQASRRAYAQFSIDYIMLLLLFHLGASTASSISTIDCIISVISLILFFSLKRDSLR